MPKQFFFTAMLAILLLMQAAFCVPVPTHAGTHPRLQGAWRAALPERSAIAMAPFCHLIESGSVFNFNDTQLVVLPNTLGQPCGTYRYKVAGNTISFFRQDMVWLCTYRLSQDSLTLKSRNFFKPYSTTATPATGKPAAAHEMEVLLIKQNQ